MFIFCPVGLQGLKCGNGLSRFAVGLCILLSCFHVPTDLATLVFFCSYPTKPHNKVTNGIWRARCLLNSPL